MKKVFHAVMLLLIVFVPGILAAQDKPVEAPACDLANLQNDINYFIGELGKLKTETDTAKIADQLQVLANGANGLRASCDNLVFTDTSAKVIGPVTFPAGIYRAKGTGNENGITVILTPTKGECGQGTSFYSNLIFNGDNGETTFGSKGCEALMEIKIYGEGTWNLSFERLSTG